MFTFQLSLFTILIALAIIAALVASLAFGLWYLFRMLRFGQYKQAVASGTDALKEVTAEAAETVRKATSDNNDAVLELVRQLQTVREGIENLAPADIRTALDRLAKLHAKDMTEGYLDRLKKMKEKIDLYQIWLRALTGGQNELSQAARRGFPEEMPEDLAGRIEGLVSQRWRGGINGRKPTTSYLS
ncbi:MAG: hypothetical protein IPK59_07160 [Rhodospirillaceae bacterium]|nr:hypothetical protein [Rhodospirillaceae bacterium]